MFGTTRRIVDHQTGELIVEEGHEIDLDIRMEVI